MSTITLADLSDSGRAEIISITTALAKFGCSPATTADSKFRDWVQKTFPSWKKSELFPFFLAPVQTELHRPDFGPRHLLLWLSPPDSIDLDKYEAEPLAEKGFLLAGFDRGGNYVAIETGSESGMAVALVDYGSVAGYGLEENAILRTGRDLGDFLRWVYAEPKEFEEGWKRHYTSLADQE